LSDLHKLTHHLPGKNIMTFSKSNLNLLPESLFTELTADQAQMLEGGKRIDILLVRCIKAGADGSGADELFFNVNGQNLPFGGQTLSMVTNGVANVGVSANFNGTANVSLFDKDTSSGNDLMGSFSASTNTNGSKTVRVSGSGSIYDVTFRVGN
jgi:hypothetical protein